jgi:hypothetical protein
MIMIDHYKLIDLLSDRLRIEIKTAGSDLLDVLESLHRTLKEHGKADLPGLGTFYMDGNNVMFEPDPQLVMDINFRYHGMQPIILEGADREMVTSDTEVHEIPETAVFVINEPEAPLIVIETDEAVETDSPVALEELTPEVESRDAEIETTLHDQLINQLEPEPVMAESLPEPPPISIGLKTPPLKWQDPHTVPINIRIDDAYVHKGDRLRKLFGVVALTLTLLAGAGFSWYNGWLNGAGVPSFHDVFPEYVTRNDPGSITLDSPTIEMQEQQQEQEQEQEQQQASKGKSKLRLWLGRLDLWVLGRQTYPATSRSFLPPCSPSVLPTKYLRKSSLLTHEPACSGYVCRAKLRGNCIWDNSIPAKQRVRQTSLLIENFNQKWSDSMDCNNLS